MVVCENAPKKRPPQSWTCPKQGVHPKRALSMPSLLSPESVFVAIPRDREFSSSAILPRSPAQISVGEKRGKNSRKTASALLSLIIVAESRASAMAEIDYRSCFGAGGGDDVVVQKRMLSVPRVDTLDDLVRELRSAFDSDRVNVDRVQDLMSAYKSSPREWIKFAHFDRYRYTRNLVDEGNGRYNLMLLAWAEGQGSSIHDHADSHCFMKMLDGSLKEVRFAWPSEAEGEMEKTGETLLTTNDVTYINDTIGLHRMENPSHSQTAVSLHLYCPPFESVLLFDQRTGHKTRGKVTFWSKYGQRTPYVSTLLIQLVTDRNDAFLVKALIGMAGIARVIVLIFNKQQ